MTSEILKQQSPEWRETLKRLDRAERRAYAVYESLALAALKAQNTTAETESAQKKARAQWQAAHRRMAAHVATARVWNVGDRVTFAASATAVTRYIGTIRRFDEQGLALVEVEGYSLNGHCSGVAPWRLRHAPENASPMDAYCGRV